MNFMITFLYLAIAIVLVIKGLYNLLNVEKLANQMKQKREKKKDLKEISFDRLKLKAGINSLILLFVGVFFFISLRLDIGVRDIPDLVLQKGPDVSVQAYENTIKVYLDKNQLPGLVVGIVDGSDRYLFTYGYGDYSNYEVVNEKTLFEVGSITKTFTGILLADAVENGIVSIDDTVDMYLDSTKIGNNPVLSNITMKHLTTHTSGLPRLPQCFGFLFNAWLSGMTGGNPYKIVTKEKMYEYMEETISVNPTGENWVYSNYGVGVLGMCLTEIHQKTYDELLQKTIAKPLGMTNTSVMFHQDKITSYADGFRSYKRLGNIAIGMKNAPWILEEGIVAAGGIRSTGEDMLLFLEALINESLPSITASKEPLFQVDEYRQIGMNWIIDDIEEIDESIIWHNGQTGGFNSYIGFYENKEAGIFVVANSTNSIQRLADDLMLLLINREVQ